LADALAALEAAQLDRGRLLDETVRASERERVRLAAELHDGPIQSIAALCFRLDRVGSKLGKGDHQGAVPLLDAARNELSDEVTELRRFMSELRPPALDEDGLTGATRDYVASFAKRTGCRVTTTLEVGDKALTPEREVVLYRLVQEALTNVSRHAEAERVTVVLRETTSGVELTVTDDGVGFDTGLASDFVRNSHFGLAGMRERVEAADGQFAVVSQPGGGVAIRATLPTVRCDAAPMSGDRSAA
jgi:two-component system NarL family sensor kinase